MPTATSAGDPARRRTPSARCATFSPRERVAPTRREASTTSERRNALRSARLLSEKTLDQPRPVRCADRQVGVVEVVLRVVHHRRVLAVSEPQEAAGLVLQVVGEVLAAGGRP